MPSASSPRGPRAESDVPLRVHARTLAALGRDLVTDDVVAVMELVKNSYDALATRVDVRIRPAMHSAKSDTYIEVADDGHGMDYDTIRNVWCVIGTPVRAENPVARSRHRSRRVTGEKGLGRLAAARLGDRMTVRTRTPTGSALEFSLNWSALFDVRNVRDAGIHVSRLTSGRLPRGPGTTIRISRLRSGWAPNDIQELQANLARLISPFGADDFGIRLVAPGPDGATDVRSIRLPEYMSEPKYRMTGHVGTDGTIEWSYRYSPIGGSDGREEARVEEQDGSDRSEFSCGPFEFEIRVWDLTKEDTRDIAEHYGETRSSIRGLIKQHRGISLYRDDVLVLPKSDRERDWLGLDLRRVSRVGTRLSTSQVVGYVRITRADNPNIKDTSDRERLIDNAAFVALRATVLRIAEILENERDLDRHETSRSSKNLFGSLTAAPLISKMEAIQRQGGSVDNAIAAARTFAGKLDRARTEIERRFGYYNRLAVVGTIALTIIHEIRNHTTVIGRGLRKASEMARRLGDKAAGRAVLLADGSANALVRLADRFAPLARRGYRLGRRIAVLEDGVDRCCEMLAPELRSQGVSVERPTGSTTRVRIDPGELDSVILNLMTNALYWMRRCTRKRRLRFRVAPAPVAGRVRVSVDDSGFGIDVRDRELIFRPGWTRKPGGIGMGLVVASEMVEDRGGKMQTSIPGELGGATFEFDLPLADGRESGERP